jgi:type I restriction enzyme S subunit
MKKYEKYQESGIEWLGKVPAHWEIKQLKYLLSEPMMYGANEAAELDDINLPRYIRITDFGNDGNLRSETFKSLPHEVAKDYLLKEGDILFARSGATVGKTFFFKGYEGQACFAGYLIKGSFDFQKVLPEYVYYFTKSGMYENWKNSIFIQSTIQNISAEKYKVLAVSVPPLLEQRAIAAYLDRKTAQIDTLLAQKEAQLQRLHQQRQALINETVTQGLDPAAPRKPSGVTWLGEVPAHWEVRRMKMLSTFVTSGSRGWAEYYSDEGEVFLRIGNLSTSSIDLKLHNLKYVTLPAGAEGARTSVQENDLLISITALLGAIGVVPKEMQDAYVNQHIALVRLKLDLINPRWAAYFLISAVGQHQFRTLTNGGTKEGLTLGDIASLLLLYPPKDEQQAIVDFIEAKTGKINEAAAAIRTQINVLKTYRQSLISEVVTGKVDVQPAAAEALAAGTQTQLWS